MSKNAAYGLVGLLAIGLIAWYASSGYKPMVADDGSAARALVTEFGTKLKMVSLLAPQDELRAAMEANYGAYVAPELLAQWVNDPTMALGRQTSSPWPERIDVVSVEQIGEGAVYRVEANIIEVAMDVTQMGSVAVPAAVQPVTLALEERGGALKIVKVEWGAYSELPQRRSVVGYWECLPHKPGAPQTEECLTAIAVDQSDGHIAVDLTLMSRSPVEYDPGTKVRVEGVFTPATHLSSDHWQQYIMDGIISATTIEKVQ